MKYKYILILSIFTILSSFMYSYAETKKIPNNSDLLIKISEPIDFNSSNFQYAKTKRLKALNYLNEITK